MLIPNFIELQFELDGFECCAFCLKENYKPDEMGIREIERHENGYIIIELLDNHRPMYAYVKDYPNPSKRVPLISNKKILTEGVS